jgi:drug/metabolite transporter (DMT)-like permease
MNDIVKSWGLMVLAVLLFSTFEICSKFLGFMSPWQITFTRFLVGGLVLLPPALLRMHGRGYSWSVRKTLWAFGLGFINIVVSMGFIQMGLVSADASVTAIIFSANPVFIFLFARLILKERISAKMLTGGLCGVFGISIILFSLKKGGEMTSFTGPLFVALSAFVFALYVVLGKKFIKDSGADSLVVTAFTFMAGSILLAPILLFMDIPLFPDVSRAPFAFLWMSVMVTGAAYVFLFQGLSKLPAAAGSLLYFVKPPIASLFAWVMLGEHLPAATILAMIIILLGVLIASVDSIAPVKEAERG